MADLSRPQKNHAPVAAHDLQDGSGGDRLEADRLTLSIRSVAGLAGRKAGGGGGVGAVRPNSGTQFEISVDGVPRSYRDRRDIALQTARFLKSRNPHSVVKLKEL